MTDGTDRSSWEPRRWSDAASDAPEALRPALQEARTLTIDSARVLRLAERVGVQSGVAAGVGLSSVAPPAAVTALKLWVYLSGAVAVSGAVLAVWTQFAARDTGVEIADLGAVAPEALTLEPVTAASVEPGRVGGRGIAPEVALAPEASSPAAERLSTSSRAASRRRARNSLPAVEAAPTTGKLDPHAELAILNRAQDALAQAPRRALTLAGDHARDFPQGVVAQEREVIAIEALLKLQRTGDATARGEAFLSAFPGSTHAPRVQQMLGQPR